MINSNWLRRVTEFWKDRVLAEKCGLTVQEICVHESDVNMLLSHPGKYICKKCGVFYK